ncbi:MAG: polysaccharide pyruvyl transferase CsaB [Anaerovibrio sp.]|uniref:polysaccharide pyruvyl transferase CsaB n=1 Tax=Anaerovibrio sp. TaxID=1872532 RepID=UPI0025F3CBD5|nr:polysaccharide pyruvyl transferase CsaB [Anaerovibrio sp.]MCR5176227.1 polysaccharide pyruvyl transferase CsaB [Anaerovibrio sp.]
MSNVVISGYYGSRNAGDEAMLAAMVEVLSDLDPNINITVISADPADTKLRHKVHSIGWLDIGNIIGALFKADLLISGGGSLLQNVTSRRSLYYYLMIIILAELLHTPVMLYAQGIGPIQGTFARWVMRIVGNGIKLITVRDKGSLGELAQMKIRRPVIECTSDPVHAIHPVDKNIGRGILTENNAYGAKALVGISVREWQGLTHYKAVIARAADQIAQEFDARIVFLPMQYPEDVQTAEMVASMTSCNAVVLQKDYTTKELLSIVGNMDMLIGVRLHALIFAAVMGVPMIGVSYDPKIDRFLESVGESPVGDLENVKYDELVNRVRLKWNDKAGFSKKNEKLFSDLRRLAMRNAELACELIDRKKKKDKEQES